MKSGVFAGALIYSHVPRNKIHYLTKTKNVDIKKCVCIHEIIRLIIMKTKMKMNNRSHTYDISRSRSRHEHNYSKYKKCLIMVMLIYIKQHLSNI